MEYIKPRLIKAGLFSFYPLTPLPKAAVKPMDLAMGLQEEMSYFPTIAAGYATELSFERCVAVKWGGFAELRCPLSDRTEKRGYDWI